MACSMPRNSLSLPESPKGKAATALGTAGIATGAAASGVAGERAQKAVQNGFEPGTTATGPPSAGLPVALSLIVMGIALVGIAVVVVE